MRVVTTVVAVSLLFATVARADSVEECVDRASRNMENPSALRAMGFTDKQARIFQLLHDRTASAFASEVNLRKTIKSIELLQSYATPKEWEALNRLRRTYTNVADQVHFALGENADDANNWVRRDCEKLIQAVPESVPPPRPRPRPGPHTFTRDDSLTKVTNTHATELTIDASGQSAHFDNRGHGGATWQVEYQWIVPDAIIPGVKTSITIGESISGVQPRQPLSDAINVLAPDLAKQVIAHYPEQSHASETYEFSVSEGYRDAKEFTITVGFVSSSVTYTYRRN